MPPCGASGLTQGKAVNSAGSSGSPCMAMPCRGWATAAGTARATTVRRARMRLRTLSMCAAMAPLISAARPVEAAEIVADLGMAHRLARIIDKEVLLRHIGNVFCLLIFGEEMVEGLVLGRPDLLRDRQPPFFRVGERRIDIENDAAKGKQPVLHHLTDSEFCRAVNVHYLDILATRIDKERRSLQAANRLD